MNQIQKNPKLFGSLANDPKVQQALGVLFNIGAGAFKTGSADDAADLAGKPSNATRTSTGVSVEDDDDDMENIDVGKATRDARDARDAAEKLKREEAERVRREAEEKARAPKTEEEKNKELAVKEKEAGNKLYLKKQFPEALAHYNKAVELDPTNIVYYNNISAVYFEQKDYQSCIDIASKGVTIGKELMANYKDVAKAFLRIATAYQALGKLDEAIEYYNKSLLEDYTDKAKVGLKKIEELKKKAEQQAYIDPAKSEEHKQKGNAFFAEAKWQDAIAEYSEALKRDPSNYKVYSNRAACYAKLMDWGRSLEDCEICIAADPKFVKAYLRKGKVQHFLKQYHKALETFDIASKLDPTSTELLEAKRQTMMAIQSGEADPERAKEAMKDPEIQQILRDPTINKVLSDMQQDPKSGQAALADPDIRKKIEKLIAAGVLQVK